MNSYRPEIDGLRALAVLSVLLFHLKVPGFSGGFVGVDVFFVISGYLITRLIRDDMAAGRFTFRRFYARRARRLFPALFFTLALSLIAACLLFSASHLQSFAGSLIAAILSGSNFLFWRESGYFDLAESVKPLLHTWSLGVEEQFYFLWPWMLFLLLRRSVAVTLSAIVIGGIVSFALNFPAVSGQWFTDGPSAIFYLLPFRVFEFAIGAAMVWIAERQPRNSTTLEPLAIAGLALIAWPVFTYTDKMLFPSYNALAPSIGTALIIYAGGARYAGLILRNKVAVSIGLISYSLYLIHWPLIVFWRYYTLQALSGTEQLAISALAFAAAFLMFRYVETPFRTKERQRGPQLPFVTAAILASSAVLVVAVQVQTAGWPSRIPASRIALTSLEYEMQEINACGHPAESSSLVTCAVERETEKTIYVWGDSHARHLIIGLAETYPDHNIRILFSPGCRPQSGLFGYLYDFEKRTNYAEACAKRNRDALAFFSGTKPTNIILHYFMNETDSEYELLNDSTRKLIEALKSHGHNVKLLGDVTRPMIYLPDCYAVPATISTAQLNHRCRGDQFLDAKLVKQNDRYSAAFGDCFINPNAAFIQADGSFMTSVDDNLLFRDTNHLTPFGSRYLIERVKSELMISSPP